MKKSELQKIIREEVRKVLKEEEAVFKLVQRVELQTAEKLIPATYIKKTSKGHQVKVTKTMMGYTAGDVIEVSGNIIIPA